MTTGDGKQRSLGALTRVVQWKDRKKSLTEVTFNQGKVVVAANFKNLTKFPHKNAQSNFKGKSKSTGNTFNKTR